MASRICMRRPSGTAGSIPAIFIPCVFVILTTIAGFLALSASPVAAIQRLGAFAALGIAVAFVMNFALKNKTREYPEITKVLSPRP